MLHCQGTIEQCPACLLVQIFYSISYNFIKLLCFGASTTTVYCAFGLFYWRPICSFQPQILRNEKNPYILPGVSTM